MKNSRRGLGIAGAVAVALALILWRLAAPAPQAPAPIVATPAPVVAEPAKPSMPHDENRPAIAPDPKQRVSASRDTAAGEQPAEHMLRGVIAANSEELGLTPAEVNRLVAQTLEFQEIQTEVIARYLQETQYDPTTISLRIPPFPMEGKALRDMYYQRLKADFPDGKFERIQDRLGGYLDESFRGFGIADQSFTLQRSTEKPSAFELAWEIRVPEGQSPSGPNPGMSYPGSLGRAVLTREQIVSGEYRFLAPIISRHFPENSLKAP